MNQSSPLRVTKRSLWRPSSRPPSSSSSPVPVESPPDDPSGTTLRPAAGRPMSAAPTAAAASAASASASVIDELVLSVTPTSFAATLLSVQGGRLDVINSRRRSVGARASRRWGGGNCVATQRQPRDAILFAAGLLVWRGPVASDDNERETHTHTHKNDNNKKFPLPKRLRRFFLRRFGWRRCRRRRRRQRRKHGSPLNARSGLIDDDGGPAPADLMRSDSDGDPLDSQSLLLLLLLRQSPWWSESRAVAAD